MFGGFDGASRFGDLKKCNLDKNCKWSSIVAKGQSLPLNRFGHSAVVIDYQMIVFGGWNGHDTMDDVYHYSFGRWLFKFTYSFKQLV